MTEPSQLDQPAQDNHQSSQEAHELSQDRRQQSARRFYVPSSKRAWLGISLSIIALAAVSAVLIAVASGPGSHQAASGTSGGSSAVTGAAPGTIPAAQAARGLSTVKSNIPSGAQVAESGGALKLPANVQSRVITWQFGPGGASLAAVSSAFGTALQQRAIRQYPLMKLTCAQLAHRVPTAQAGPPIPVAAMQKVYEMALAKLAKGAAECQAAISVTPNGDESLDVQVNAALLNQSISELAAGSRDIFRSTAEIEIASRQSH